MTPFHLQQNTRTSGLKTIFAEWQSLREVKVPVLDCGGVFKDYKLKYQISWVQVLVL